MNNTEPDLSQYMAVYGIIEQALYPDRYPGLPSDERVIRATKRIFKELARTTE